MDISKLDYAFPFLVFAYGFIMVMVIDNPWLAKVAEKKIQAGDVSEAMAATWESIRGKRLFAYAMFTIGGLWSLQNIWLG